MAYHTKDAYFAKQLWAENNILSELAQANLKQENRDKLFTICTTRHNLHQNLDRHAQELANGESAQHENKHKELAELAKLTKYELDHVESMPLYQDHMYDLALDGYDYEEWLDYCNEYYIKLLHDLNQHVENYLRRVDQSLDINICPTGATRKI